MTLEMNLMDQSPEIAFTSNEVNKTFNDQRIQYSVHFYTTIFSNCVEMRSTDFSADKTQLLRHQHQLPGFAPGTLVSSWSFTLKLAENGRIDAWIDGQMNGCSPLIVLSVDLSISRTSLHPPCL